MADAHSTTHSNWRTAGTPVLALLLLAAIWGRGLAPLVVVLVGLVLVAAVLVGVHHAEGESRGHARVDGIATRGEHARGRLRRERMSRRHHPLPSHHLRHRARARRRSAALVLRGVEAHAAYGSIALCLANHWSA